MQPHSAALILAYLHLIYVNVDRQVKKFSIGVSYTKRKSYDIEVKNVVGEGNVPEEVELEVTGFWSCRTRITRSGNRVTIEHDHLRSLGVSEVFSDYKTSINGETERSKMYGAFKGSPTSDYKNLVIYGEYKGKKETYYVTLNNKSY